MNIRLGDVSHENNSKYLSMFATQGTLKMDDNNVKRPTAKFDKPLNLSNLAPLELRRSA